MTFDDLMHALLGLGGAALCWACVRPPSRTDRGLATVALLLFVVALLLQILAWLGLVTL